MNEGKGLPMPAIFKKLSSPIAGARQVAKVAQVRGNPTATHTPDNPLTKRCLGGNLVSLAAKGAC